MALQLCKTVAELERTVSVREYVRWLAFYRLCPFGPVRGDLQAGIVAATAANIMGAKPQAKPGDFLLEFHKAKKAQTPDQIMAICKMIHREMGGKV